MLSRLLHGNICTIKDFKANFFFIFLLQIYKVYQCSCLCHATEIEQRKFGKANDYLDRHARIRLEVYTHVASGLLLLHLQAQAAQEVLQTGIHVLNASSILMQFSTKDARGASRWL